MVHENGTRNIPTRSECTYLPVLYYLTKQGMPIIESQIMHWLGVTSPAVTQVLQQFSTRGLITKDARGYITLTAAGMALAEAMVRRHCIMECFLTNVLGIPWHQVHQEALRLEHAISPALEKCITALVGHATTCPHGNPIPGCAANTSGYIRLDRVAAGSTCIVRRAAEEVEEDTELLRYLAINQLIIGAHIHVVATSSTFGMTLRIGDHTLRLHGDILPFIWCDLEDAPASPTIRADTL